MTTITPEFLERLQNSTDSSVSVIITVVSNPKSHVEALEKMGFEVNRTYSLRPMIAASGSPTIILALADEDWITKVEPDSEVRAI